MFDITRTVKNMEINYINNETLGFKLSLDPNTAARNNSKDMEMATFATFLGMLTSFYLWSEEINHAERIKDQERTVKITFY